MRFVLLLIMFCVASQAVDKKSQIMNCLYKEVDAKQVLIDKGLNTREHIENLLYSDEHKEKYFLKALVLDYYYNSSKAAEYYDMAYQKADFNEKGLIGLHYALFLQKRDKQFESTKLLRGIDVYNGKGLDIPRKIAYQYEVYGLKKEIEMVNYFKLKGIINNEIQGDINDCSK